MFRHILIVITALLLPAAAQAGPPARLADLAWMAGSWEGEGIEGAPAAEAWSPIAGGQMPDHFRQLKPDGSVMFYEILALVEKDGSLVLRLKHFNADLTGWEEKAEVRDFPLTAVSRDRWEFSGIVYQREGRGRMTVEVLVRSASGAQEKLVFRLRRRGR
jgi:hypothetical protein